MHIIDRYYILFLSGAKENVCEIISACDYRSLLRGTDLGTAREEVSCDQVIDLPLLWIQRVQRYTERIGCRRARICCKGDDIVADNEVRPMTQ